MEKEGGGTEQGTLALTFTKESRWQSPAAGPGRARPYSKNAARQGGHRPECCQSLPDFTPITCLFIFFCN